jgi:hypothetical protein
MCGVRVHASYATIYKWGYLHEALNTYGAHVSQLLFTLPSGVGEARGVLGLINLFPVWDDC